ncbi:glycoside hydrolase family 3 C-terminal domain-containing protein [Pedobacter mucosus]|uniref:glycoside hydrolase family 3 C-terminal domain-containing protein n=1 Tax=Pedobacter mucosus TaxID=2895286 RepID=UPI001EE3CB58|nr:glycoside hydrolase family 3 C-terminal domain-containing protein [Pedobacter mucosus]UKT62972.1 glycoside hydrolase family 3 C-terminal domain-containing protein [Pedobacter mucosus]
MNINKNSLIIIFAFVCFIAKTTYSQNKNYPFQNTALSFEKRVDDIVSRLTLEEKVAQMLNSAPAVKRLGIPAYDWWNEVLHGVARTPYKVTVYPQAIAMAASFDVNALFKMADFSALEGRAIYNKAILDGKEGSKYVGLTYWTPNINIFRDPRWGRGQETYGEDPFLTSMLGDSFVKGLQGDDPKYLKAAACAKHFAVHSGPESSRHTFNVDVSAYDLWDTYLPAFQKLVVDSKVVGVMCAYNAFRTQPCCASDILLTDILRKQWNFKGYVTSDCGAIDDFYKKHKTHKDAESAAVDAVFHGTDVDCGHEAYLALVQAVKHGNITEAQLDVSLRRLFMIRFKLGFFDPVEMVKYAQTPASVLESPEHKAHALKLAQESMVLLKNENNTLPLRKNLKKIVVLGPNADNSTSILGNYNGNPSELTTVLAGIKQKVGKTTEIIYEKAVNFTNANLLIFSDVSNKCSFEGKPGFKAEYFKNVSLSGTPLAIRQEVKVNHAWQEGENVIGNLAANNFSARYTTNFKATENQKLAFEIAADNGYRLLLNGKVVLDEWVNKNKEIKRFELNSKKDSIYNLVVEFWQGDGQSSVRMDIGNYLQTDFTALAAKYKDADAFIFVGGISPQLEGEQMRVDEPGFTGGDRTSILLPPTQTELMKALKTTGKPIIFVMMTGSAIATPWESENVPSILNAWYGGQSAGKATADILFGDYNPSGRLPITFYKGDGDLASFNDYNMDNRTYRYLKNDALYGFGYGLSYTTFSYAKQNIPFQALRGKNVSLAVTVTNKGKLMGDEVAQLYIVNQDKSIKAPIKALKGFQRINLKAGESKVVKFELTADDLSYIDSTGAKQQYKGDLQLTIGGSQPDEPNKTSGNVVKAMINIK